MKKTFLIVVLHFFLMKGQAQIWSALPQKNNIYSTISNPAFATYTKYELDLNIFAIGANVSNNGLAWSAPFSVNDMFLKKVGNQYKNSNGKLAFTKKWITNVSNNKPTDVYIDYEVLGPAFLYRINKKNVIGGGTRKRIIGSVTNIDSRLIKIVLSGLDSTDKNNIFNNPDGSIKLGDNLSKINFIVNAIAYQEYFVSFSRLLFEKGKKSLSAGLTPKFLTSSGYIHTGGNDFGIQLFGFDSLKLNALKFAYNYSNLKSLKQFNANPFLSGTSIKNNGLSFDVGGCYHLKNKKIDSTDNEYKLSIGFSISDIGFIKVKKEIKSFNISTNDPITIVPEDILNLILTNGFQSEETQSYFDSITKLFDVKKNYILTKTIYTPAMFNLNVDYSITKHIYISYLISQNILNRKNSENIIRQSYMSLIPSFRSNDFGLSLPFTLAQDYKRFDLGLQASYGPLMIGTNSLKPMIRKNNYTNYQIYFGLHLYLKSFKKKSNK